MREIKFRVWDFRFNNMIHSDSYDICGDTNKWQQLSWFFRDQDSRRSTIKHSEPMQYTGLKDKNGNEIYEGDIIKSTEFTFKEFKEDVKYGTYNIGCNGHEYSFEVIGPYVEDEQLYSNFVEGNIEIIGNIYENPELLKN